MFAQASLEDFRDEISRIIDRLDNGDEGMEYRTVRAGASLAAALLCDSTAGSRPAERQALVVRALRMLEISKFRDTTDLIRVLEDRSLKAVDTVVSENLLKSGNPSYATTVRLLLAISRQANHSLQRWAAEKIESKFAHQISALTEFVDVPPPSESGSRAEELYHEIVWAAGPAALRKSYIASTSEITGVLFVPKEIWLGSEQDVRIRRADNERSSVMGRYRPMHCYAGMRLPPKRPQSVHSCWEVLEVVALFSEEPSARRLADALKARIASVNYDFPNNDLPWPVAEVFSQRDRAATLHQIEAGDFGDAEDWLAAEARWNEFGVTFDEIVASQKRSNLREIAGTGAPRSIRLRIERGAVMSKASIDGDLGCILEACRYADAFGQKFFLPTLGLLAERASPEAALNAIKEISSSIDMRSTLIDHGRMRLIDAVFALPDTSWSGGDLEGIARRLCPSGIFFALPDRTTPPPRLFELLNEPIGREWASRLLFSGIPRRREFARTWISQLDMNVLRPRPGDSDEVQVALIGLRSIVGNFADLDLDASGSMIAKVAGHMTSTLLRRLYRCAQKDRILDGLIISAAQAALSQPGAQRAGLIALVSEVLSARESKLDDPIFAENLKLPEALLTVDAQSKRANSWP